MALKPTTVPTKRLAATISASATAIQLNNIEGWNGSDLTSSDFGTQLFAVLRNDANTLMELIELDPATIASASITILRRGLKFDGDLTTEVTANKRTWVKNETLVELGADSPQLFQWFKEYIDAAMVSGGVAATTSVSGIVELATQADVDAGTVSGGTGTLVPTPALIRAKKYNDYVVDTGAADAYVITPSPAITAYAAGQEFTFKAANSNTGASTINVNGLGAKSIKKSVSISLAAGDITTGEVIKIVYDGTNFQLTSRRPSIKFGGTGADGALAITSGATNIDLGNEAVVVKNYSSISITGTGSLTFTNPHANGTIIILKSQGDVTLTSSATPMIDASGIGAAGGAGPSAPSANGSVGSDGYSYGGFYKTNYGGGASTSPAVGAAGAVGAFSVLGGVSALSKYAAKYPQAFVGAGGGGGASTGGTAGDAGDGGRGGGALIIECAGAWNFTTASGISVAGKNGGNASGASVNNFSGGGGGGGGGFFCALYGTLTANSGTITISGGTGGNCNKSGAGSAYGGGGGGSLTNAGSAGTSSSTDGAKTGGDGGAGLSLIAANTEFA